MQLDQNNRIVILCAEGMNLEGQGRKEDASELFHQAWNEATNDLEKFIAAHYVARHQENISDKLKWDQIALNLALQISDENVKGAYPSLYLNIAKGFEDLEEYEKAEQNYLSGLSSINSLQEDGYGKMIKNGIENGLERLRVLKNRK